MAEIIEFFSLGFKFLEDFELFGLPFLVWLIIPLLFGIIGAFIKGKKE